MKKVFLSLAFIAVLTVVSCKKADAAAEEVVAVDSTVVAVDSMALPVDSMAVAVDSMAAEAPAAE
jgi:hypothetical protein